MVKVVYNACYGGYGFSNYAKLWFKTRGYDNYHSLPRHHPILIECVETLGKEANSRYSNLVIREINRQYYIEDNDGYETVITPEDDPPDWVDGSVIE